jgi:hypothetical protein
MKVIYDEGIIRSVSSYTIHTDLQIPITDIIKSRFINENGGFTRLSFTKNTIDQHWYSIYISGGHAIIVDSKNLQMSIVTPDDLPKYILNWSVSVFWDTLCLMNIRNLTPKSYEFILTRFINFHSNPSILILSLKFNQVLTILSILHAGWTASDHGTF